MAQAMAGQPTCERCGVRLRANDPEGYCLSCQLREGLKAVAPPVDPKEAPKFFSRLCALTQRRLFKALVGAIILTTVGLVLRQAPVGDGLVNASYDYLFRFGARPITNKVTLILLDNAAYTAYATNGMARGQRWDRGLHAKLLDKLTADKCPLVVFDIHFEDAGEPEADDDLAVAIRNHGRVVLAADLVIPTYQVAKPLQPEVREERVLKPFNLFLDAAATNWGIIKPSVEFLETPRRHWPFPAPDLFPSLPWTAARLAGARLPVEPVEQWLRYYGDPEPFNVQPWSRVCWASFSFHLALEMPPGHFRDTVVFIGSDPKDSNPKMPEEDKFTTPYTRWNDKAVGGVKIMATTFLNLVNNDWLQRPPSWFERLLLTATGLILGALPFLASRWVSAVFGVAVAGVAFLGTVWWSYHGDFWFPWLIVSGVQAPGALALTLAVARARRPTVFAAKPADSPTVPEESAVRTVVQAAVGEVPDAPDYHFPAPPFGEGAFGKVWLVRNAIGQWQALKTVYQAKFGENPRPFDMEFAGIQTYKPISEQHLGLLRVEHVSQKKPAGYFYYVMELGDSRVPGWEANPANYQPLNLAFMRGQADQRQIPIARCVEIGMALAETLEFLHRSGLTHRDIKPSNIIFVNGRPKLADVGLVTRARLAEDIATYAGTPGYMPPPPEMPGTRQADIYALGMVLFVISTGRDPAFFPELKTTLVMSASQADFILLNPVILKACHPDITERYASAGELHAALLGVQRQLPVVRG